jgi:hypothetical protein
VAWLRIDNVGRSLFVFLWLFWQCSPFLPSKTLSECVDVLAEKRYAPLHTHAECSTYELFLRMKVGTSGLIFGLSPIGGELLFIRSKPLVYWKNKREDMTGRTMQRRGKVGKVSGNRVCDHQALLAKHPRADSHLPLKAKGTCDPPYRAGKQ